MFYHLLRIKSTREKIVASVMKKKRRKEEEKEKRPRRAYRFVR
jgi:hypothetical protein